MHRYMLHNGEIHDASEKLVAPGQVGFMNGWGVFSTVRVADGVLFEWPRHWARIVKDATLMRVPLPDSADWLEDMLLKLIDANQAPNATLRVVIIRNKGGAWEGPGVQRPFDVVAFTTGLNDWGTGVKLGVVPDARHAGSKYSGTKVASWSFNLNWYEEAHERGFDEVLLLNEHGNIAECTSANLFAVFGNEVVTPPLASGCLPGITRALLLEHNANAVERDLKLSDLERADELFITSTTRDLLPVVEVEGLKIKTGHAVRDRMQQAFTQYIRDYVAARARKPASV